MVQTGPNPVQLSDGNYLFLYNSARYIKNILEYNVGYVILDKNDPKKVIQRSDDPILNAKQNCVNYNST